MRWTLGVKLKLLAVAGATAVLFASVIYWAIPRVDPQGPFILGNLVSIPMALLVLLGALALTTLLGGLWLQRDLPGVAWMIVGAGWLGLAIRSWPIDNRLIYVNSPDDLPWFYARLLAELGVYFALSGIVVLLTGWATRLLPGPGAGDAAAGGTGRPASPAGDYPALGDQDELMALAVHVLGGGVVAMLIYVRLVNNDPAGGYLPGQMVRGQVLFALIGGFFLSSLAAHQVSATAGPWRLALSVPVTGAVCYLLTIFLRAERHFDYQPPMRISAFLPVDLMGLALPAAMAAFLFSYRLRENARREAARRNAAPRRTT